MEVANAGGARFCDCKVWLALAAADDPPQRDFTPRGPVAGLCFSASMPIPRAPLICAA
jgi:hypothetical protein